MSMVLDGITNQNEYYTNHYFSSVFEENAGDTISRWRASAKENERERTPWALLRDNARAFYPYHDRYTTASRYDVQTLQNIQAMADAYLGSLGYPEARPESIPLDGELSIPVYLELKRPNGAPLLWVLLSASTEKDQNVLEERVFSAPEAQSADAVATVTDSMLTPLSNEELCTRALFALSEPPRFLVLIGMNQIALIDRNKWNEKRYLQFELEDIFSRREETTLQAMAVLLHKESLCPEEGAALLDELDSNSQKHAAGVSQDLKFALRESIELLGNEVLYDLANRQGRDLNADPVDAGELTLECLRYMYRMLFVLFIEARPELGYAPIREQTYLTGYSLESLRDIADTVRDDVEEVGGGFYLHETLSKLYELIYTGYPENEEEHLRYSAEESLHDTFIIAPLKAHIFDPEYTPLLTKAKLRNSVMLRIVDRMSLTRPTGRRNERRGRISYANLGINQLGAVYEALLSYRGFIAEEDLYEVKREGDKFNELDVGYFVKEHELSQYTEEERVRYEDGDNKGKLRMYPKGTFIYRLAGREREKSASYYTPEVLTRCLVKYALKELLEGKTADEILELTVCEPAMGSAAFLNETINQLAEAYLDRKQKELGETVSYENRFTELQKIKMYIADRNVYGIDLNPVAVELAEVSLWLNTIYSGGFVPWFNTQLVCGNSLIGARRQCYRIEQAQTTVKGLRWYENAPERVPLGTARSEKGTRGRRQFYHFLLGDPGMCAYTDKVIKELEPDNLKKMKEWNKRFVAPIDDDDVDTLLRLSGAVDELWQEQIALRRKVEDKTRDSLSVFGHEDGEKSSYTTIRQKDRIYSELYKSEHLRNAGPYARLKFAMDYWCALWFWPIEQAELLPSRSEFFFDMSMILEGTTGGVNLENIAGQMSFFEQSEAEQLAAEIMATYGDSVVDIPTLRAMNPRLDMAARIAEQNRFMHWELEFADLFEERGGFDLVIGNPPWIKVTWEEKGVLSDKNPMFAVRNLSATQTTEHRTESLKHTEVRRAYFEEYEFMTGEQAFLNAVQNYSLLKGQQTNLYKCFLPQAMSFAGQYGVFAFVHPDGIFNDPKGGLLRESLYPRLKYYFQFMNVLKLFADVDGHVTFSTNVYSNRITKSFQMISNIYSNTTIDDCYDDACTHDLVGLKNEDGNWSTTGHPERIIDVGNEELKLFSALFDDDDNWKGAKLPKVHTKSLVSLLRVFAQQKITISDCGTSAYVTQMWDETNAQNNGIIERNVHFPSNADDLIYSGPHIYIANPFYKASRRVVSFNKDYDVIDLSSIKEHYYPRINYKPKEDIVSYYSDTPCADWGERCNSYYRILCRRMLNLNSERTLISAIVMPNAGHISTMISISMQNVALLLNCAACLCSLPFDAFLKILGKGDMYYDTISKFPLFIEPDNELNSRVLALNALSSDYAKLWADAWSDAFREIRWSKNDERLCTEYFHNWDKEWSSSFPARMDYVRRQLLVEIDVIVALKLGLSLNQLLQIYHIQFPVLQQNEADTWYDANGRIVFTNNRSLTNVGFSRPEWENGIKGAPAGKKFYRTITDDTMPGGPVERTIEYVAPFDRCDREQDYETAWRFFAEKYGEPVPAETEQPKKAEPVIIDLPVPEKKPQLAAETAAAPAKPEIKLPPADKEKTAAPKEKKAEPKPAKPAPLPPKPIAAAKPPKRDAAPAKPPVQPAAPKPTSVPAAKPSPAPAVKPKPAPAPTKAEPTGLQVYHKKFGFGTVIEKYRSGKDYCVRVRFENGDVKSFMESALSSGVLEIKG